jgi:formylglycine-generating enzyme required for sulfatase activity
VQTENNSYWVRVNNASGIIDSAVAQIKISQELVLIPAGSFTMGRTSGDTDTNANPVQVTVDAFYLGTNEVTIDLWSEVRTWAIVNGYTDLAIGRGKQSNHPVDKLTWWDVVKWCNARSEKEGLTPCYTVNGAVMKTGTTVPLVNWSANGYRLPTESEWEKAARGGVTGKRFPWGTDTISHNEANYQSSRNYSYDTSIFKNTNHPNYTTPGDGPYTSPVGAFAANGFGLNDVAGNVVEWCWDWYGDSTYVNGATNPRGAATGSRRVARGGNWNSLADECRISQRSSYDPTLYNSLYFGFRVARNNIIPSIITQPTSIAITSGQVATLTIIADRSSTLNYQWYQGTLGTTTTPVGTNSSSFTTPVLTNTTSYWVRVSNSTGSVNSSLATITCSPAIITQPASQTLVYGRSGTLTVTASGSTPLKYQWYQGAVGTTTTPVGTNSASFTTPLLTITTSYWVQVSNSAGIVNSTLATLSVPELALIPTGAFQMGVTSGDTDADAPSVTVNVSAFYIGMNEVRKDLWDEVRTWAADNGYTDLAPGAGKAAAHPVHAVSWWDVVKWCNARSQKEGLTPVYTVSAAVMKTGTTAPTVNWSANGYRLPTEAEWEKAARGGLSGMRFPMGSDTITQSQSNYYASTLYIYDSSGAVNNYHPTYAKGSFPYTSPVGSFTPNGYGLYDMAGNVSEWCWDWYGASTYVNGAIDPSGAISGADRVRRGGGWQNDAFRCRASYRFGVTPSHSDNTLGFRLARSAVP